MNINEDDSAVVAKIKRLLALAEHNSNPNEAAAALARAQKLMHKHGISTDDIKLSVNVSAGTEEVVYVF